MVWRTVFPSPVLRALVTLAVGLLLTSVLSIARYRLEASKADIDFSQRANARIAVLAEDEDIIVLACAGIFDLNISDMVDMTEPKKAALRRL